MALSGSGGAYYRAGASVANLYSVYTRHLFARSTISPSSSNNRFLAGLVGTNNQTPHEHLAFNHVSGSFVFSNYHRNNAGSYFAAQMTQANWSTNAWHSIGAIMNSSNIRSYLDGVLDGTSGAVGGSRSINQFVDLLAGISSAGALDSSSQALEFDVAEYALWDVALDDAEMAALAKGMRANRIRPQNLRFYAPCIRSLIERRNANELALLAGSTVVSDHPRVYG